MKLRLANQLTLMLVITALLAVMSVSGVVAWNLRSGFSDYLSAHDQAQLDRLAQKIALVYAQDPGLVGLRGSHRGMRELMDALAPSPPPDRGPQQQRGPGKTHPGAPAPLEPFGPQGTDPSAGGLGPPPKPQHALQRAHIVDASGAAIAGPPLPPGAPHLESEIRIGSEVVAYAWLPRSPFFEEVDAQFLKRQYAGMGGAVLITFLIACVTAWIAARRWSRPLIEAQRSATRISEGDFSTALPSSDTAEIAQLLEAMSRMASSLQALEGTRRKWLAEISHELRTPLTVLRGELEAIHDGVRQPTPIILTRLRDESVQMTRLVDDLHTLAVSDLDGMPCSFDWGGAAACVERAALRFQSVAQEAGLALHVKSAPGASAYSAYWDFGRIAQLIGTLLDNSVRYTHAPGAIEVSFEVHAEAGRFWLQVSDSAPAVVASELAHLFEPLFRSSRPVQHRTRQGSGLGLAIAKAIVTAHGGEIVAMPSAQGGLTFKIDLPLEAR
jgi:two-component system, OmpR family, sensor histidine kinase BaeS